MLFVLALAALGANAAELPSRGTQSKPAAPKAQKCEIGGEPGIALPGGGCMRVSGYVSAGVSAGTVKH